MQDCFCMFQRLVSELCAWCQTTDLHLGQVDINSSLAGFVGVGVFSVQSIILERMAWPEGLAPLGTILATLLELVLSLRPSSWLWRQMAHPFDMARTRGASKSGSPSASGRRAGHIDGVFGSTEFKGGLLLDVLDCPTAIVIVCITIH